MQHFIDPIILTESNSKLSQLVFFENRMVNTQKNNNYINKDILLNKTYFIIENYTIDHFLINFF